MPDFVIATPDPDAAAAFWEKVLGDLDPPCRRHPNAWYSSWQKTALVQADRATPCGLHINVANLKALSDRLADTGGAIETDAVGRHYFVDPAGARIAMSTVPEFPVRIEERNWKQMVDAVGAIVPLLKVAMVTAGLTNGRLVGPRNIAREALNFTGTADQPTRYRLIVDGDRDLTPIDALLSGIVIGRSDVTAMRFADVPEAVRDAVDRVAIWLDDPWPELDY